MADLLTTLVVIVTAVLLLIPGNMTSSSNDMPAEPGKKYRLLVSNDHAVFSSNAPENLMNTSIV